MADETERGWYDKGGLLPPSVSLVHNDSGEDIAVLTAEQIRAGLDYILRRYGTESDED